MNFIKTLLRSTLLQYNQEMKRSRSLLVGATLSLVPIIFLIMVVKKGDVADPKDLYIGLFVFLYAGISIIFLSLLNGIGIYQRELEGGTVPFMLDVPMKRSAIHISKYFSSVLFQLTFLLPSALISYSILMREFGERLNGGEGVAPLVIMVVGGVVVYTAFFSLLSLVAPKPLLVAFLYSIFWEYMVGLSTLRMRKATVMFYLKSLIINSVMKTGEYGGGEKLAGTMSAIYSLFLAGAVGVALGAIVMSIKNFEKS